MAAHINKLQADKVDCVMEPTAIITWGNSGLPGETDVVLYRGQGNALETTQEIRIRSTGGTASLFGVSNTDSLQRAFATDRPTDTYNLFQITLDGQLWWSAGTTAPDTHLYRAGARVLKLIGETIADPGYFKATEIIANGAVSTNPGFLTEVDGLAFYLFQTLLDGEMWWGTGAAGADTHLYRSGVGALKLIGETGSDPGYFTATRFIGENTSGAATAFSGLITGDGFYAFSVSIDGSLGWGTGDAGTDVQLYRQSAGTLCLSNNLILMGDDGIIPTDLIENGISFYSGQATTGGITELVTGGDMEDWNSATDLTDWTEGLSGTSTINREAASADVYGGTYSCRFDVDAGNSSIYLQQAINITAGIPSTFSFWYKTEAGKTLRFIIYDNPGANVSLKADGTWGAGLVWLTLPASTSWKQFRIGFNSHPSYAQYMLRFDNDAAASSSFYLDDVSWTDTIGHVPHFLTDGGKLIKLYRVIDPRATAVANSGDATTDGLIDALRDAIISLGLLAAE
jgi:hypothetical protein